MNFVKWQCGHRRKPIVDEDETAAKKLPCLDCFLKLMASELGYPQPTVERWLQRAGRF